MTSSLHLQFPWQLLQDIYTETNSDAQELKLSANINEIVGEILVKKNKPFIDIQIKAQKELLLTALEEGWMCQVSAIDAGCDMTEQGTQNSQHSGEEANEPLETADSSSGEDVPIEEEQPKRTRKLWKRKAKDSPVLVCPVCLNTFCKEKNLQKHLDKFHEISWETYTEAAKVTSDVNCIRERMALEGTLPHVDICCICQLPLSRSGRSRSAHLHRKHQISLEEYNLVSSMTDAQRREFLEGKSAKVKESKVNSEEFCHLCDISFTTLSAHATHVKSAHSDDTALLLDLEKKRSACNTSPIVMQCPLCTEKRNGKAIFRHFKDFHRTHLDYDSLHKKLTEKYREEVLANERTRYREKLLNRTAQCKFCEEKFPHRWARARHQGKCAANPKPSKLHHCSICTRAYTSRDKLEEHIKEHPEDGRYFCEQCGKSYKYKSGLYIHLRKSHNVQMKAANFTHSCNKCDQRFFDKTSLSTHMQRKHAGVRDKTCDHCGKGFRTQGDLHKHIKYLHQNNYKYNCQRCGHGVDRRSHLQTHRCSRVKRIQTQVSHASPPVVPENKTAVYEDLSHAYVQEAPPYVEYQNEAAPSEPLEPRVPSYMLLEPAVPLDEQQVYRQEQHFI